MTKSFFQPCWSRIPSHGAGHTSHKRKPLPRTAGSGTVAKAVVGCEQGSPRREMHARDHACFAKTKPLNRNSKCSILPNASAGSHRHLLGDLKCEAM